MVLENLIVIPTFSKLSMRIILISYAKVYLLRLLFTLITKFYIMSIFKINVYAAPPIE